MSDTIVEGTNAQGYLAVPASGSGAGVLVLHAWWGLNATFARLCDRLADAGFVAYAPDLYGGRVGTTIEEATALIRSLDYEATPKLVSGAVETLRHHPATAGTGIGAVGFSMGAAWASLLATTFKPDDLSAVVLFYGVDSSLEADAYRRSHAAFQLHLAPDDEWATDDEVGQAEAAMHAAETPLTVYRYDGTKHWFFEPDRPEYDAEAAEIAWQRTVAFLKEHLD